MKNLIVDIASAKTREDIFVLLLKAMDAPTWHGKNLDAIDESVAHGGNDTIEPPYSVTFINAARLSSDLRHELLRVKEIFVDAKKRESREVSCDIVE